MLHGRIRVLPRPPRAALPTATPLTLARGCAELSFGGGTRIVIEAPARFTLDSSSVISLASGRLAATVPGGGFLVKTPTATIADLGTEFGVAVEADGSTSVEVFKGRVKASPLGAGAAGEAAMILSEGQAAPLRRRRSEQSGRGQSSAFCPFSVGRRRLARRGGPGGRRRRHDASQGAGN